MFVFYFENYIFFGCLYDVGLMSRFGFLMLVFIKCSEDVNMWVFVFMSFVFNCYVIVVVFFLVFIFVIIVKFKGYCCSVLFDLIVVEFEVEVEFV